MAPLVTAQISNIHVAYKHFYTKFTRQSLLLVSPFSKQHSCTVVMQSRRDQVQRCRGQTRVAGGSRRVVDCWIQGARQTSCGYHQGYLVVFSFCTALRHIRVLGCFFGGNQSVKTPTRDRTAERAEDAFQFIPQLFLFLLFCFFVFFLWAFGPRPP